MADKSTTYQKKEKQEEEKGAFLNDFFKQVQNDYNTKMAPIF